MRSESDAGPRSLAANVGGPAEVTVSVVLPTLNRRAMVTRAVASVLAQTGRDFELIVVDCGSTDGTASALAHVLSERVRLLTASGAGASAARNVGLRDAAGEIVAFLDSDDFWRPEHLSVVCRLLERHPDAVLASTCPRFDVAGRASLGSAREVDPLPKLLAGNDVGWPSCVAVRRSALEAVGGFDERLTLGEDNDLWRRLSLRGFFVFLRRRTVTVQRTVGSLSDRGRGQGLHFEGLQLSTTRLVADVGHAERPELRRPALGAVHFAQALSAVARGDGGVVRAELRNAVELLPDLSRESERVLATILWYFPLGLGRQRRLLALEAFALSWPDPDAETAIRLRGVALIAALLCAQPRSAVRLLTGMRFGPTARLTIRLSVGIPYHVRRRFAATVHRRREPTNVGAGGHVTQHKRPGSHFR